MTAVLQHRNIYTRSQWFFFCRRSTILTEDEGTRAESRESLKPKVCVHLEYTKLTHLFQIGDRGREIDERGSARGARGGLGNNKTLENTISLD